MASEVPARGNRRVCRDKSHAGLPSCPAVRAVASPAPPLLPAACPSHMRSCASQPPTWLSMNSPTSLSSSRAVVCGGLQSTLCFLHCTNEGGGTGAPTLWLTHRAAGTLDTCLPGKQRSVLLMLATMAAQGQPNRLRLVHSGAARPESSLWPGRPGSAAAPRLLACPPTPPAGAGRLCARLSGGADVHSKSS